MPVKLLKGGAETFSTAPLVIKNPKNYFHIHTYGGLSRFFTGLAEGRLLGTACPNPECLERRIWLPPRIHCPDCYTPMEWREVEPRGTLYTHSTVLYPGSNFRLSAPCPLISVEIKGVCTKLMSYLKEGAPRIGMPLRAVFNTAAPTYTILDLAWLAAET